MPGSTARRHQVPNSKAIAVLLLATVLIVFSAIWIIPVVGGHNSFCDQDPYAAGCR